MKTTITLSPSKDGICTLNCLTQHGQLITLYSVAVSKYNEIKDITITSGTSVEVTEILHTVSLLVINSYCIHTMLVQYVRNLAYFVTNIIHCIFYKQ